MYKTVKATYDNGRITCASEPINFTKSEVILIFLEEEQEQKEKTINAKELFKYKGILKSFKEDPVAYQRRLRDEW